MKNLPWEKMHQMVGAIWAAACQHRMEMLLQKHARI